MKVKTTWARKIGPVCLLAMLITAVLAGFGTWIAFVQPAGAERVVRVTGLHTTLGDCVASALRSDPRIGSEADRGALRASVTALTETATETTRIMYEGHLRLNFTVTLRAVDNESTEARVMTFPHFDPVPAVETALNACTGR